MRPARSIPDLMPFRAPIGPLDTTDPADPPRRTREVLIPPERIEFPIYPRIFAKLLGQRLYRARSSAEQRLSISLETRIAGFPIRRRSRRLWSPLSRRSADFARFFRFRSAGRDFHAATSISVLEIYKRGRQGATPHRRNIRQEVRAVGNLSDGQCRLGYNKVAAAPMI